MGICVLGLKSECSSFDSSRNHPSNYTGGGRPVLLPFDDTGKHLVAAAWITYGGKKHGWTKVYSKTKRIETSTVRVISRTTLLLKIPDNTLPERMSFSRVRSNVCHPASSGM